MTVTHTTASTETNSAPTAADVAAKLATELRREIIAGDDQMLSRTEAAAFLGRHYKTLEAWARVGLGPKVTRFGPRNLGYRLGDLREYVRNPPTK